MHIEPGKGITMHYVTRRLHCNHGNKMDVINNMKAQLKMWPASEFPSLFIKYTGISNDFLIRELFGPVAPTKDIIPGEYSREELLMGVVNGALQFGLVRGLTHIEVYHFMYLCLDMLTLLTAKPPGWYHAYMRSRSVFI